MALHLAAHSRDVDTTVWLERVINAADNKGETAFLKACQRADSNLLTILINAGADKDVTDISGHTALHFAASGHNVETAAWLLDYGADANATDTELRQTPLHIACANGDYEAVPMFVEKGADVGVRDKQGRLPRDLLESSNPFVNASVRGHEEYKALLPLLSPEIGEEHMS
jgi:ankyrin repeat protein